MCSSIHGRASGRPFTSTTTVGVPVATTAINGSKNAALIAVSILALQDAELAARLEAFRANQTADVLKAEL